MLNNVISKIKPILEDIRQSLPADLVALAEKAHNDINNLNNIINKEIAQIKKKQDLDDDDKSKARRLVFEKAGRKLEVIKDKRSYASQLEALEAKLTVGTLEADPVLKFLREKEIRDRLVGMTERQILSHFGDSLFDGSNPLLVDAILNAPTGFELLSEKDLEKLRAVRTKAVTPKSTEELKHSRKLNTSIMQMFNMVKKEMDALRKKELPPELLGQNY
jgi:hypothetical protein